MRDQKTFIIATFSADYKSTVWPNIVQIDKSNPWIKRLPGRS